MKLKIALGLISKQNKALLQFTVAQLITIYHKVLLQFTIAWLLREKDIFQSVTQVALKKSLCRL